MSTRHFSLLFALFALLSQASANPPAWWADGNPPIITGTPENNHGPANIGQAKWMASEALRALTPIAPQAATAIRANLAGIVDFNVPADPKPADWADKQKAPLLLGQLKAIALPFYNRLNADAPEWVKGQIELNNAPNSIPGQNYWQLTGNTAYTQGGYYPWNPSTPAEQNKAIATIGQLKAVFSLRFENLSTITDTDSDGMPDAWEIAHGLDPEDPDDAQADPDGDGIVNSDEYANGSDPNVSQIHSFAEVKNPDGTITYTWVSPARSGDWFRIDDKQPNGTWKVLYSTTYGSARLPYVSGSSSYSLTLDPATDYIQ